MGRITVRRAEILGYLAQTIRHSHRAIALKKKIDKASRPIISFVGGGVRQL
jgi:hypothetical protein